VVLTSSRADFDFLKKKVERKKKNSQKGVSRLNSVTTNPN
jgi:hypothetical protein